MTEREFAERDCGRGQPTGDQGASTGSDDPSGPEAESELRCLQAPPAPRGTDWMTIGLVVIVLVNLVLWGLWKKTPDETEPSVAGASPGSPVPVASASPQTAPPVATEPGEGKPTEEVDPPVQEVAPPQATPTVVTHPVPPPVVLHPAPPPPSDLPPTSEPEIVLAPGQELTEVNQYHLAIQELRFHGVDVQPILEADSQACDANQVGNRDREMAFRKEAIRLAAEMLIDSYSEKVTELRRAVGARRLKGLKEALGSAEELCRAGQLAEGILQYRRIVSALESS